MKHLVLAVLLIPLLIFASCGAKPQKPPKRTPTPTATRTSTVTPTATPQPPQGPLEITGTFSNPNGHCILVSSQSHVWIHDAVIGPCDGSGIKVQSSTDVTIERVTILHAKASITMHSSSFVTVKDSDLRDPLGPKPEGQQILVNQSNNVTIDGVYTEHTGLPGTFQEDAINFYRSTDSIIKNSTIVGGGSPTGCGVVLDDGAQRITVANNRISWQANCGVGVANGVGHYIDSNDVRYTRQNYYAWNQYSGACEVTFVANTGDDGVANFWNGGNCTVEGDW